MREEVELVVARGVQITAAGLSGRMEVPTVVYIKRNVLLRGADKTMNLDQARWTTVGLGGEETLARYRQRFGEAGLGRIFMMARTQHPAEFKVFFGFIHSQLPLQSSEVPQGISLECDNALLPQGPAGALSVRDQRERRQPMWGTPVTVNEYPKDF